MDKCKIKKICSLALYALAAVVLIWGIVASCMQLVNDSTRNSHWQAGLTTAKYDKDGKAFWDTDKLGELPAEQADAYTTVDFTKDLITRREDECRSLLSQKIALKASEKALAEKKAAGATDETLKAEIDQIATDKNDIRIAEYNLNVIKEADFVNSSELFFGAFLPAVVLLLIAGAICGNCRKD